jgi:hypothetical protein
MKASDVVMSFLYVTRLLFSLFVLYLTLGWKVRRARRAFEKQLIRQGMAREDAKRLSAFYSKMKNSVMNTVKSSIRSR